MVTVLKEIVARGRAARFLLGPNFACQNAALFGGAVSFCESGDSLRSSLSMALGAAEQ
jgi:hypothetical protein